MGAKSSPTLVAIASMFREASLDKKALTITLRVHAAPRTRAAGKAKAVPGSGILLNHHAPIIHLGFCLSHLPLGVQAARGVLRGGSQLLCLTPCRSSYLIP